MTNKHGGIQLLRLLAMLMIVTLHVLGAGGVLKSVIPLSKDYSALWFWETCCYGAVNCYALISGYVGWNKDFKYTKLIKFWVQNAIFVLILSLITYIIGWNTVTIDRMLEESVWFLQYWYVAAYLGLLIIVPVLNNFIQSTETGKLKNFAIASFIFFSAFTMHAEEIFSRDLNKGYSVLWLALCYLWGGIIAKLQWATRVKSFVWLLISLSGTVFAWLGKMVTEFLTWEKTGEYVKDIIFVTYTSPFVVIASVGLFCFFVCLKIKVPHIVSTLAESTLGVFLVHFHFAIVGRYIRGKWAYLISEPGIMMYLKLAVAVLAIYILSLLISVIYNSVYKFVTKVIRKRIMNYGR